MKMIRLFIVTLAIALSCASMPSFGGLSKIQELKTGEAAEECPPKSNIGCLVKFRDELETTKNMLENTEMECSQLLDNLSLKKNIVDTTMPDKTDAECSQPSHLDNLSGHSDELNAPIADNEAIPYGTAVECSQQPKPDSLSESGDEFHDSQVDTTELARHWLAKPHESKEVGALKNSTMVTNNDTGCNVAQDPLMAAQLLINPSSFSHILDSSLMVDHDASRPSDIPSPRLVEPNSYHCNDDNVCLSFSTDSRYLLSTGRDNTLIISAYKDGEWIREITISNNSAVSSSCFSPDSRHLVVTLHLEGVKVYSLRTDNQWEEICTINCSARAAFSPNSRHLVIYNSEFIEVWDLGTNRVIEQAHVSINDDVKSAYFTSNSAYLIMACDNEPNKVLRLENDEHWRMQSSIPAKGKDCENRRLYTLLLEILVATGGTETTTNSATIFCLGADGEWMEKATLTGKNISSVGTSADGIHIMTKDYSSNGNYITEIWSLEADEVLKGKDILKNTKNVDNEECIDDFSTLNRKTYQDKFSNNCRHVAILSDSRIILCSQNEAGVWIEKVIIEEKRPVQSLTFNADSTKMILSLMDENRKNTFRVWVLRVDGEWVENNILSIFSSSNDDGNSIVFSADGSNMGLICATGSIKIWGENEEYWPWKVKDWVTGSGHHKIVFSPDGLYAASIGDEHAVKIIELNDKYVFYKYFGSTSRRQLAEGCIDMLKALFLGGLCVQLVSTILELKEAADCVIL